MPPSMTPKPASTAPVVTYEPRPQTVRETYVERDSGIFGNPFFWMWVSESNRNNSQPTVVQAPVQVETGNDGIRTITKTVVDSHNPGREFATFALGSGLTVLLMKRIKL